MAQADDPARAVRDGAGAGEGDGGQPLYARSPFSAAKPRGRFRFRFTPPNVLLVVLGLLVGVGTGWIVQDPVAAPATPSPAPPAARQAAPLAPKPRPPVKAPSEKVTSRLPGASGTPVLPPDSAVIRDPSGVTLAVPVGWRREVAGSVHYRSSDSPHSRFLRFWPLAGTRTSATRALRVTVASHRQRPGYELHALHPTTRGSAELVHSYDSPRTGQRLTLVQRVFPTTDGRRHVLAVAGPAAEWPRQRTVLETALRHFAPGEE
ncbi:hypothetical protein [Streptomyces candidus]|uniref:Serine/arginine repetitive matrix protein 2 n=1 Tax=Streptomyces candidus TaxID=67283 RepID=A0A7X0HEI9_9ACTN|nr:hypothetical protein [Streptomyces candidus]MBB6435019.1 hypothetical protein [Streptomyces candidus]GHH41014.1 hypothetical protein GCM10018773_23500 [Streptomyces candidus]